LASSFWQRRTPAHRTQAGSQTATYDARNRQLTNGTETSTYTARGTLASRTTGGSTQTFTFDAFDRLTTAGTTTYTYDSLDRLVSRGTTNFTYASPTDDLVSDGAAIYSRTPDGDPLAITDAAGPRAIWSDRHSDVVGTYTPTGGRDSLIWPHHDGLIWPHPPTVWAA
jgi:YD repeat-containing protein